MVLKKKETVALGGFAIIFIVLHNVVHLLLPVKENEFTFSADNVSAFIDDFARNPVEDFFSFFGWIGVSVFIFISGYGLSARYGGTSSDAGAASRTSSFKTWPWFLRHYLKLVMLLAPALLAVYAIDLCECGRFVPTTIWYVLKQSLVLNFVRPSAINPGIYWYVGMAAQLYLIFPFVRRLSTEWLALGFIAVCLLLAFCPDPLLNYLRHNCVGWLPEFLAGLIYFRLTPVREAHRTTLSVRPVWYALGALFFALLIIVFSYYRYTFFLSGPAFVGFILTVRKVIFRIPVIFWIGSVSAAVYVCHGVVRKVVFNYFGDDAEQHPMLWALITLAVSFAVAVPYTLYYKRVLNWIAVSPEKSRS